MIPGVIKENYIVSRAGLLVVTYHVPTHVLTMYVSMCTRLLTCGSSTYYVRTPTSRAPNETVSYHDELSSRTYEALARQVLQDGTVTDKGRTKLRLHRQKNGVDALHHLRVLKKLGWSLDQLEEGTTLGPAVSSPKEPSPSPPASPPPQATRK